VAVVAPLRRNVEPFGRLERFRVTCSPYESFHERRDVHR
jgi:hypothetical protein